MAATWFLRFGVVFALLGMSLGAFMGATHNFMYVGVHAHINLVGWVSMFLAGLFYRTHPEADNRLALLHLCIAVPAMITLVSGIYGAISDLPWGAAVAGIGSIVVISGMLLFAVIVFTGTARKGGVAR